MKKLKKVTVNMLVMMVLLVALPTNVLGKERWERWENYDIRTKPNEDFTAELLDDVFNTLGQGGVLLGKGKVIIEAGEKNGISPAILASMIAKETGWGKSTNAKVNNNTGGIKCRKDYPCQNGYTKFPSVDESIRIQAELLNSAYVGAGLTTIRPILEKYAPPSDGNSLYGSGGYIDNIGSMMEVRFKQTADKNDLLSASGGNYTEGGSSSGGGKVGESSIGFVMQSTATETNAGVDKSEGELPSELSYSVGVFSKKVHKFLTLVGVVLSVGLIVYMGLALLLYVALVKGYTYDRKWFDKVMVFKEDKKNTDVHSKDLLKAILGRVITSVALISLFLTGLYIEIMAYIYLLIERGIGLIF